MSLDKNQFQFSVENKIEEEDTLEIGGIGLANIRRRLELIYRDQYELKTKENSDTYSTTLSIDLSKAIYSQKP